MAATIPARQPFGVLDDSRLQSLASTKNRQNAITASLSPLGKPTSSTPQLKRRRDVTTFEDDFDAENIDPSIFNSPSKRTKNLEGATIKKSSFVLTDSIKSASSNNTPLSGAAFSNARLSAPSPRAKLTPISASRGSPKHKRMGGILNQRRTSSSPFTRVNPPKFVLSSKQAGAGLPFSIDAAISGSITSSVLKPSTQEPLTLESDSSILDAAASTSLPPTLEESMPKNWFFDIHEDTPEEEAANLMEHSTNVLDISSDDDGLSKRDAERKERGKENVPPSDFMPTAQNASVTSDGLVTEDASNVKQSKPRFRKQKLAPGPDAMTEDIARSPLGDLEAKDYFADGLDESSVVTIEGDASAKDQPASRCPQATFDFEVQARQEGDSFDSKVETSPVEQNYQGEPSFKIWDSEKLAEDSAVVQTSTSEKVAITSTVVE